MIGHVFPIGSWTCAVFKDTPAIVAMLSAVALLALVTAACAIPFPLGFLGWNRQAPFVPSKFTVDPPKVEHGWADPRILGGRFIDVSFLSPTLMSPMTLTRVVYDT